MNERTIMIVDDEPVIRRMLARVLCGPTRTVIAAGGGSEALALASEQRPDLILLDVNMPGMSGLEVLGELRRRPGTRTTPVILLSGAARAVSDKVGGFELGADDYVTKPCAGQELLARVEGLLRRHALDVSSNPLTGLPGNPAIETEASRRLQSGIPFAFFYIDIDRFKAFNDAYGFAEGDRLLLETSMLIRGSMGESFVGHVGGDDFVAMCGVEEAPYAANRLAVLFDEAAARFVGLALRPPTLSIGVVRVGREFAAFEEVAAAAAELKAQLKAEAARTLSRFAFDRRNRAEKAV